MTNREMVKDPRGEARSCRSRMFRSECSCQPRRVTPTSSRRKTRSIRHNPTRRSILARRQEFWEVESNEARSVAATVGPNSASSAGLAEPRSFPPRPWLTFFQEDARAVS